MKIEQLPSGAYRVRKTINKKTHTLIYDRKPTQAQITSDLARLIEDAPTTRGSFISCANRYIESKNKILSPTTITSYRLLARNIPEWFDKNIKDITQIDVQNVINEYAENHSPKSVKNYHGFIATVLKMYRPNMSLHTTLPKGKPFDPNIPEHDDVVRILEEAKNTEYSIVFQLGCLGLRKGEILALKLTDLVGDTLTVDKVSVLTDEGVYKVKNLPKTVSSVRKVVIPDSLAQEIREKGYIYKGNPQQILRNLHYIQDKLGIERCRFHDLRHYFASYAHYMGMSDADIMACGGWKTDEVMKRVYRHSLANYDQKKNMANNLLS